jgi:hypothetical protein
MNAPRVPTRQAVATYLIERPHRAYTPHHIADALSNAGHPSSPYHPHEVRTALRGLATDGIVLELPAEGWQAARRHQLPGTIAERITELVDHAIGYVSRHQLRTTPALEDLTDEQISSATSKLIAAGRILSPVEGFYCARLDAEELARLEAEFYGDDLPSVDEARDVAEVGEAGPELAEVGAGTVYVGTTYGTARLDEMATTGPGVLLPLPFEQTRTPDDVLAYALNGRTVPPTRYALGLAAGVAESAEALYTELARWPR